MYLTFCIVLKIITIYKYYWLWGYQSQYNSPKPLPCLRPGNNLMVYPPYHLPHFDYCWGYAWSKWSIETLSPLHWSASWILSSLLNISDCIFGSLHFWQFWTVLPWSHSWYCKGVFMTQDSLTIDQTPYVGSSTHPPYWSGSSRTYTSQWWQFWKYCVITSFPDSRFRSWLNQLPRIHHRECSLWNWYWSSTGAVGWACGSCWKDGIVL